MPSAPTRQSSPKAGATLLAGAIQPADYPAMLLAEAARLNRAGLTTCSENGVRSDVPSDARPAELLDNGDDTVRQVGIKIWVDGSPWIGNVDLSFPYLDSDATRTIGVVPGSCAHATTPQIHYWGDIIVDGLFGPEHASRWMPCGSARWRSANTPISLCSRQIRGRCRRNRSADIDVRATYLAGKKVYGSG